MRILVTGGAGFIGSHLVDYLLDRGDEVIIYDNLEPQVHQGKKPDYLNPKAKLFADNVEDYDKLKSVILDTGCEVIFHFAARVGVAQSQYEIKKYVDTNVGGTANLLDILVNTKHKVKKIIVAASMSSYGEGKYICETCGIIRPNLRSEEQMKKKIWELYCPVCNKELKPVPIDEDSILNCNSIYALTKKMQEEMCLLIGKTYQIPTVVLRFFNVYGPRQSLSNPYTGVCAIFMSRIKNNNPPIVFEDGLQTRDFIYVDDVIRGCVLALESEKSNYEVFNVGMGSPITIKTVAEEIAKVCNSEIVPFITNRYRKGDVRHCFADISKIKNLLGFEPQINFNIGLKKLFDWSKDVLAVDLYDKAEKELLEKQLI